MKTLIEMAQEIVVAQASAKAMTTEELKVALQETFNMLKGLEGATEAENVESVEKVEVDPKKSIRKNKIICLECGAEFKTLSWKHLQSHGLDAKSYRKKYGFRAGQSLCAKNLSERRSESAKARGIPEKMRAYLNARSAKKAQASAAE